MRRPDQSAGRKPLPGAAEPNYKPDHAARMGLAACSGSRIEPRLLVFPLWTIVPLSLPLASLHVNVACGRLLRSGAASPVPLGPRYGVNLVRP